MRREPWSSLKNWRRSYEEPNRSRDPLRPCAFRPRRKSGQLAEIDRWLARFADGIKHYPEVSAMIRNPIISERDKVDFIEKLFSEGTPQLLRNFFRILIEKKRFAILGEVYDVFHAMFEQSRGVTEVELLSALPYPGNFRKN